MSKVSHELQIAGLEALQRLIQDHGDSFRWSISKRGRVWLTLTHWDEEKYNTSVELDGMSDIGDVLDALHVLAFGHYAKCFGRMAHTDTWLGTQATKDAVPDAIAAIPSLFAHGSDSAQTDEPNQANSDQVR